MTTVVAFDDRDLLLDHDTVHSSRQTDNQLQLQKQEQSKLEHSGHCSVAVA